MRKLEPGKLVIASHNPGKVREINDLIAPYGLEAISAGDLNLPEPEETEMTFAGNAEIKALSAAKGSGLPALADDSGLCVDALNGAPGVFSARWAGPDKNFAEACETVVRHMGTVENRKAHFVCALCLAWPDGHVEHFEGRVDGEIQWPPRGTNGFGYDPIFQAEGYEITFGEMDPADKHAISHRARAFEGLKAALPQD